MKSPLSYAFFLACAISYVRSQATPVIEQGFIAKYREDFAYQVSITLLSDHICSGALISKRNVLTAASCIEKPGVEMYKYDVNIGDLSTGRNFKPTQKIDINNITVHKDYDPKTKKNDLAIIHLTKDVVTSSKVKSIGVVSEVIKGNYQYCNISGWGMFLKKGLFSDMLLYGEVSVLPEVVCKEAYPNKMTDTTLCASSHFDACYEVDKGVPLVCDGKLAGILSWSQGCGVLDGPRVYTNLSAYSDWISTYSKAPVSTAVSWIFLASLIFALRIF